MASALPRANQAAPSNPFELISRRAETRNAINLGQGLPEFGWPHEMIEVARSSLLQHSNQYPPSAGLPVLREAVAQHYRAHHALTYDPGDVVVTSGGTEALAATIFGLVRPGDEVILIEPFYGAYLPLVERAGGLVRTLRLEPPDFELAAVTIERCVTNRTRMLIFNNPLNPFGVNLGGDVLHAVATVCCRHNLIAVSDEVWEHALLSPASFRSLPSLPGMRDRTVKIGAAGKIFSLTGWKVGWTCTTGHLTRQIEEAHMNLTFATSPHLQHAVAFGLGLEPAYFQSVRSRLVEASNHLRRGLMKAGFAVLPSNATHFINIDLRASGTGIDDVAFCATLLDEWGVAAVPVSTFYRNNPPANLVRLCYAKRINTLDEALPKLSAALRGFKKLAPI